MFNWNLVGIPSSIRGADARLSSHREEDIKSTIISQLRKRVAAQFKDVEQVDESIVRYTRKMGDLPFAVYYLDIAENFPETSEKLTKYQDRVIGSHYFEGEKSLQWSNYLYFITDRKHLGSSQVRQAKELIERDRGYRASSSSLRKN